MPNFQLIPWPNGELLMDGEYYCPQTQAAWLGFQAGRKPKVVYRVYCEDMSLNSLGIQQTQKCYYNLEDAIKVVEEGNKEYFPPDKYDYEEIEVV